MEPNTNTIDIPTEVLDALCVVELAIRGMANERFATPDEDDYVALIKQVDHVADLVRMLQKRLEDAAKADHQGPT